MTVSDSTGYLALEGRVDALYAPELDEQLSALHKAGARDIIIDLQDVSYMSSSGLRILLLAHRRQRAEGGQIVLANTPERVLRILRMAGFDQLFEFEPSESHEDTA